MTPNMGSHSRDALRPSFAGNSRPIRKRAQGRPGARCTRGLACGLHKSKMHTSIQVQRRASGLPCAMALRLISCSPRRTGFLPPSPPRALASQGLDVTTATSGPHDFAVRSSTFRQGHLRVHRIPPRVRDVRTPLLSGGTGRVIARLQLRKKRNIFHFGT